MQEQYNKTQDNNLSQVQQNSQIGRDANAQSRNAGLERKNNGSPKSSDGRRTPSSKNQRNIDNNEQNLRNAADVAIATNNPYGVAAGKAFKAADKITGGRSTKALAKAINTANKTSMAARLTQKALNRMNESGMGDKLGKAARAKNKFSGDKNINDGKKASDSSTNDNEQQQSEEIESNGGSIDLFAKIMKYKWPIIVAISFFSITFYLCIMMATIADGTAAAGAFSNEATNSGSESDWDKTAEDRINTNDEDKTDNDVEGGIIEESYLTDNIPSSVKFVAKEKLFNSDDIADYYGVEIACGGKKSKKCTTGTEYKFYLKMYDIYFLYKNQYGVSLDLPLIMATLNYGNDQMPVVFKQNLNDYSRDDVKSDIYQGDLSWEFDYKNLAGYTYLNANDFRYDMQILAKNMVTKKISYKCGDTAKEAKDIETSKYSSELKCDSGTYNEDSVTETYELDLDKYDDFLLEYIEHKFYLKGSKVENITTKDDKKLDGLKFLNSGFYKKIVYFNQGDYSGHQYGNISGATIASHGCGPTSLAIVLSSFKQANHDPIEITKHVCSIGGCTSSGTTRAAIKQTVIDYGLKVDAEVNDKQKVLNALSTGKALVIAIMHAGHFTNSGHFIVLTGTTSDGKVTVADPGHRSNNKDWDFSIVYSEANTFWIITE